MKTTDHWFTHLSNLSILNLVCLTLFFGGCYQGCDSSSSNSLSMEEQEHSYGIDLGIMDSFSLPLDMDHLAGDQRLDQRVEQSITDGMIDNTDLQDQHLNDNESDLSPSDPALNPLYLPLANPLNPEVPAYPYPSDFYTQPDPQTRTGRRLIFPPEIFPFDPSQGVLNQRDGFSRIPIIVAFLPEGIDVQTLPSPIDHERSIDDDSTVWLIDGETGERHGVLAEIDALAPSVEEAALLIRPLKTLKPNHLYIVILKKGIARIGGQLHEANEAFKALRDGIPTTVPEIEQQRADFETINQMIDQQGLQPEEVILAWGFHTGSEEQMVTPLLEMQQQVMNAPIEEVQILTDRIQGENRQITGEMSVPNFVGEVGLVLDEQGRVQQQGTRTVPFALTIPLTIEQPRPVILYGHGFLGQRIQATRGTFNELCRNGRFSAIAVNFGMHEGLFDGLVRGLLEDFTFLNIVIGEVLQTFVNTTFLARVVRERLADQIVDQRTEENRRVLDGNQIHYLGISNGGTFGLVFAATSSMIQRAVIVVGGGGLVHFLQRATQWNDFKSLTSYLYPNTLDQQLFLSLLQSILDPIDSMSYVSRLLDSRFPNTGEIKVQMHMAIHDSQVNNLVTEWVARTAQMPLIVPSPKSIWGLEEIQASQLQELSSQLKGVLQVYDEHVLPSPITNIPPEQDNGTHGTVRQLSVYQDHVTTFLETGVFTQVCEGACDPE